MRRNLMRVLLGLEVFVGVGGLYGGFALLSDPRGSPLGMPVSMLEHSPFSNYLIPGIVLFAVNGVFPLVAVFAQWLKLDWAKLLHLGVGVLLTGWMVVQLVMVGFSAPLQAIMLVVGLAILALALATWTSAPKGGGRIAHA
ncbi:MAG: hypothetical protein ACOZQL_09790 [Myxococcota bacterium]